MISHVTLGTADLKRAIDFYAPLTEALGLEMKFADSSMAAWKHPAADRPLFVVTSPFDGKAPHPGNGGMIALIAPSRAVVDRCHALALAAGGIDEGAPGLRPQYHENYYGAYMRDLDGNKLCICCHKAPAAG